MFVINQNNSQIEIIERATGKHVGSFGRPGTCPGQFNQVHGIAVDSKGNVYLSENRGRRIHKFQACQLRRPIFLKAVSGVPVRT